MSSRKTPERGYFAGQDLQGLADRLREGAVTSAELTAHALDAVRGLDQELNAFVSVDAEGALESARKADAELAAGDDLGPLHGIPVAVKDIIETAGMRTTMGSAHFADHVSTADAECVRRLRAGGAVIVGKTTTHEFAYGPTGDRAAGGASRNPHDPAAMSGGSSGGSAAAVAAGMVPLAVGTDTGGSVRIPAALCGVAGFKPAYGAVPADGVFPLSRSLDHVGVIARTPRDCRTAYRVLAGLRAGPPRSAGGPATVGWIAPGALFETDREVEELARAALSGRAVQEVELGDAAGLRQTYNGIQDAEAYAVHAERVADAPELFTPEVLERLQAAARTPGWRHVRAFEERQRWRAEVARLLSHHDLLALPTTPFAAPAVGQREIEVNGREVEVRWGLLSLTSPWNIAGVPALTVPVGTSRGLPVGLQLVCRPGDEDLLFAFAAGIAG
ncbi:aspartyl-tRNA(Asn)/glutamyl-tRNA(Gln) amidotransferase subunit A [Saccharopolyspora erythraea NRRL 2338]|uniref:Enantiomer-selective amidase n=2 Tax=Saccharopolyspora erythraea TaxID=1836 RepID=A4FFE3_SACEN|nr:amidase [Saccharopolyspora erythraea]PFG96489.1 aspartyl-tRNA(Asn)/glutamyl-tRNA(Gln) amidotransferase subunit A [Saccharopolyspora erythraea NRRL 2338]QRK92983.1 amidase [Saccharopolyspora erythraea]CAM02768.1 enantiomer-selective amidase [Saccharopolyspora erythraea NRRL 2338]